MTRRFTLADAGAAASVAVLAALSLWVAVKGPSGPLPMHFGLDGQADRLGDRNQLALVLAGLAVLAGALGFGMERSAGTTDDPARARGLRLGQWMTAPIIALVGVVMTVSIVSAADTLELGAGAGWIMALLGVVFAAVGSFLGRLPPNIVAGVRTPWAFKSRLAWDRSNRLAGRLFFWIGLIALVAAPVAPQPAGVIAVTVAVLIAAAWSVIESWRVWRTDPDRQPF